MNASLCMWMLQTPFLSLQQPHCVLLLFYFFLFGVRNEMEGLREIYIEWKTLSISFVWWKCQYMETPPSEWEKMLNFEATSKTNSLWGRDLTQNNTRRVRGEVKCYYYNLLLNFIHVCCHDWNFVWQNSVLLHTSPIVYS